MEIIFWFIPGLVAVGTGVLAWFIMQSRMEVALAREREAMAESRGTLEAEKVSLKQAITAVKEQTRREALDDFLADVHVEQRHFMREQRMIFNTKRILVMQERIFFRNLPLSNWIEHEVMLQEGEDADRAARLLSFFADVAGVERPNFKSNPLVDDAPDPHVVPILQARRIR